MFILNPLYTQRLSLRSLSKDDATQTYCDWLNDPETNRFLEARFTNHNTENLSLYIENTNASPCDLLLGVFSDHAHIGNVKIGPIDSHHGHAPIGLFIGDQAARGKGYATEIIQAATGYAFNNLGLYKIVAGCYASNIASHKAFIGSGYIEEARLKDYWNLNGRREDHLQLGITLTQWHAKQP